MQSQGPNSGSKNSITELRNTLKITGNSGNQIIRRYIDKMDSTKDNRETEIIMSMWRNRTKQLKQLESRYKYKM